MRNIYKYIIAIVIGIFVGVITLIGQKYLPINFNFLANPGAIWLIPAFLLSCYFNLEKKNQFLLVPSAYYLVYLGIIFLNQ